MIDWNAVCNAPVMGVFGEPARYLPARSKPFDIQGTFHEAYKSVDLVGGMGIDTESPALGVMLSDFPEPPSQNDRVLITATTLHGGGTYIVKKVQPNGVGAAVLLLNQDED